MNLDIMTMCRHALLLVLMCFFAYAFYSCAQKEDLTSVAEKEAWTWKDRSGEIKTRAELDKILADHAVWLESDGERGLIADLSGADLRGADLSDADQKDTYLRGLDLRGANLSDAVLVKADLSYAVLLVANMRGADLRYAILKNASLGNAYLNGANLNYANLRDADLSSADLSSKDLSLSTFDSTTLVYADLSDANLSEANLSGAFLTGANLSGAFLTGANLSNALLLYANLEGAMYEPTKSPPIKNIQFSKNLDRLIYGDNYGPIQTLKQGFKDADLHYQYCQVIAAIRRHHASLFDTVMFDWTCEYGANPTRPLRVVAGIWLICTVFYWYFLHRRKGSGLYLLATGKKVNTGNERIFVQRLRYRHPPRNKWFKHLFRILRREAHALGTAVLFSLMSAFNIGFRELNFGRWIRMLQPREFDIKAHGIARVISGTQSLLSIYLVALAVLSYFGTPFDR